jgi:DNA-binding Xre family transcriptional regulator
LETEQILKSLKLVLKSKKINYIDASKELNMSESGFKKLMIAKDISVQRLNQICDLVDISFTDLLNLSQSQTVKNIEFTDKQNEFLCKNHSALMVFWMLTVEEKTPTEIKKNERISAIDFQKLIYALEKIDLIKTNPKGRITSTHKGLYRWDASSSLVQKLNRDWSRLTLEKSLRTATNQFHRLSYIQVSKKNRDKIIEKFSDLMNEIANLHQTSKYEKYQNQLVPLSIVVGAAGSGFFDRE